MNRSFIIPVGVLILLVGVLGVGLILDPREVPLKFIDKLIPTFSLKDPRYPNKILTNQDLIGKVWLVNVWASWCKPCRDEHPILMQLANSKIVSLFGLNYQDRIEDASRWLNNMGDPYELIGADITGQIGLEWGVRGTPETFLVDKRGMIRFQKVGLLDSKIMKNEIIPLIEQLKTENLP